MSLALNFVPVSSYAWEQSREEGCELGSGNWQVVEALPLPRSLTTTSAPQTMLCLQVEQAGHCLHPG